jgi:uncharacterized protein YjdB
MRLKSLLKSIFIFGLVLFLGVSVPFGNMLTAYANETQDIKLNVNSQTIVKGKNFSLYVYNLNEGQTVTFVSSDPAIVSVNENGVVTGNLVGTATIVVTVTEGENTVDILSCEIKVGPPAVNVKFSRLELNMVVGQKVTLERIVLPLNAVENPKFSTYDRTIATVSAGGRVTAKAEGSTYIFAQLDNGRFAVCKVYIFPEGTILEPEEVMEEVVSDETNLLETLSAEEQTEETKEITDPFLKPNAGMDFETFIKNLNAANKSAESAESTTGNAN